MITPLHRFSYIHRIISARDWARILVFAAFIVLGLGIAVGAYFGFLRGFWFFQQDAYFGPALTVYTLEATFFIALFLVFVSATVSGIWTLFNSPENQFLLTTPYSRYKLLASRFLENAFASAWPMGLLGIPAIAAFARVAQPPVLALTLFTITLLLLFFSTIALTTLLNFILVKFFRALRGVRLMLLIALLILFGVAWVGRTVLPQNLPQLFYAESLEKTVAPANLILAHFQGTPAHPAVQYLFVRPYALWPLFQRIFAAGMNIFILILLARYMYTQLLARSFEGVFIAGPRDRTHAATGFKKFPLVFNNPFGVLLEKDIFGFFRSRRELSRALFLVLMLFLYLFLFRRLRKYGVELTPETLSRILLFNLAVIGYFITTLSLRFVFPLVSLEGRSAWAIFTSPVKRATIFWEKLLLGLGAILLAIVPLAAASVQTLNLHGFGVAVFLRIVLGMCAVLVTLTIAVGAIWPNFRDQDPDKLSTTMPGLFATALSLLYVALASFIGFLSIRAYLFEGKLLPTAIAPLVIINVVIIITSLLLSVKHMQKLDITA